MFIQAQAENRKMEILKMRGIVVVENNLFFIFKGKTDSVSGKIHLLFLALGSFEASLSFLK